MKKNKTKQKIAKKKKQNKKKKGGGMWNWQIANYNPPHRIVVKNICGMILKFHAPYYTLHCTHKNKVV